MKTLKKGLKFLRGFVRSEDMFGHAVTLNFNKRGDVFQTNIGGFFSVLIKLFFVWFLYSKFSDVLFRRNSAFAF